MLPPLELNAILSLSKSAEIERGRSPKDLLSFGAWGEGGFCGEEEEKERRWSTWGLRLKSCQVRAKILTSSCPRGRVKDQRKLKKCSSLERERNSRVGLFERNEATSRRAGGMVDDGSCRPSEKNSGSSFCPVALGPYCLKY